MAGVAAGICCAVATVIQLSYWQDNIALFSHNIDVTHENFKAHYCLGTAYSNGSRPDLAVREFKEALRINPDEPYSRRSLAMSLQMTGQIEEAIAEYTKSLEKYPDDFLCHNDLGMALLQQGRFDEAIQHFSEALRLKPTFDQASSNLQFAQYQKAKARNIQ
jgi:tetratricopeptide (TPR) repeat protein